MMRGFSLVALLLAVALGLVALHLALDRVQTLRAGLARLAMRASHQQATRILLAGLAHDLRRDRQGGCLPLPPDGDDATAIRFVGEDWSLVRIERDAAGRLAALLVEPAAGQAVADEVALVSCCRIDLLRRGRDFDWQRTSQGMRLALAPSARTPLSGNGGHHAPSLLAGPLVRRRYRFDGTRRLLVRQDVVSGDSVSWPVAAFSLSVDADGVRHVELTGAGETLSWRLTVAPRQHGSALLPVLVLCSVALLLAGTVQRLILDEQRLAAHLIDGWRARLLAEYGLSAAETEVARLDRLPGHAGWFGPGCRMPTAPAGWQRGLCAVEPGRPPPWHAASGRRVLSPCLSESACIALARPAHGRWPAASLRGRLRHCADDPLQAPVAPDPCFVVERLDSYRGSGLYRITVRAWGNQMRSEATLQSYYAPAAAPPRLGWRELR